MVRPRLLAPMVFPRATTLPWRKVRNDCVSACLQQLMMGQSKRPLTKPRKMRMRPLQRRTSCRPRWVAKPTTGATTRQRFGVAHRRALGEEPALGYVSTLVWVGASLCVALATLATPSTSMRFLPTALRGCLLCSSAESQPITHH